ncbi:MAG TPA: hypothetical protein VF138_09585 [Caulobacteraceae bacterium]
MTLYLTLAALVGLCAVAAAAHGGRREWLGVAIVAAAAAALALASERGSGVWLLLAIDLGAVVLLGRLAWKAPGLWPLWLMAALGVGAATSLAFLLQPDVSVETYRRALLLTRFAAATALLLSLRKQASHS